MTEVQIENNIINHLSKVKLILIVLKNKILLLLMLLLFQYAIVISNQNDSISFVEISNIVKLKIPMEIFKDFEGRIEPGTEGIIADDGIEHNFPHNFFITPDGEIIFDIYRKDGYSILIFDKYGELEREIMLHLYSDYFKEKGSVYNTILVNNNLLISGLYKFFLMDIQDKSIMMKSERILRGLGADYYNENMFFMTFSERIYNTSIDRIVIYDNGKVYYHPKVSNHNNQTFIIDSTLICPLLNKFIVASIDTNTPSFIYKYDMDYLELRYQLEECEYKFLGGSNNYYYLLLYSQSFQPNDTFDNVMFYNKPDIHIIKLNNDFEFYSIAKLNYNINLNKLFIDDRMQLTFFPGGLIFHYSKLFNKLYVLYFEDDGAYIGVINLNW